MKKKTRIEKKKRIELTQEESSRKEYLPDIDRSGVLWPGVARRRLHLQNALGTLARRKDWSGEETFEREQQM